MLINKIITSQTESHQGIANDVTSDQCHWTSSITGKRDFFLAVFEIKHISADSVHVFSAYHFYV